MAVPGTPRAAVKSPIRTHLVLSNGGSVMQLMCESNEIKKRSCPLRKVISKNSVQNQQRKDLRRKPISWVVYAQSWTVLHLVITGLSSSHTAVTMSPLQTRNHAWEGFLPVLKHGLLFLIQKTQTVMKTDFSISCFPDFWNTRSSEKWKEEAICCFRVKYKCALSAPLVIG